MAAIERTTTISLPESVRKRLLDYQVAGKTPAQAIDYLMDEVPPDYFRRDIQRALLLPRMSLQEFRRRAGLPQK